ncbi:MAG: hypothetical protein H6838_16195 [Planctomycetes bacterium]|nr:hypothetical protein [Planctomycetota bacterium]MCB9887034.1 hypothetical protein [Planctomycetota bacterium]
MRAHLVIAAAALAAPVFVTLATTLGHDPVAAAAQAPLQHRDGGFVGAQACQACHLDHHASWQVTHHAHMTQRPDEATIVGAFDGREVRYEQDRARPFRDGQRFCMEVPAADGGRRIAEVALAVGSRRYQQYFERRHRGDSDVYVRLPILWHVADRRWLHLNTVFLGPDDADWNAHAAVWNENCIFCHNTAPEPRLRSSMRDGPAAARFDSQVADLGIACESCHGPGAAHAAAMRDPVVRYAQHFAGGPTAGIVDPPDLDQTRSVSVCGQCHGARLPRTSSRLDAWFHTGPTYRPGDDLLEHVTPIQADTPVRGKADPELFALRFWRDGTPRLTAYELQGVLASPCYRGGAMTCLSCHAMHRGDPKGQLRPELTSDAMCTQCHPAIGADVAAHTHHAAGGPGSSCVECHMPKVVFGVLEIHRSHRVEVPDPARDAAAARPNACTLCHTDRSLPWAAERMRQWWGDRYAVPTARADKAPIDLPDAIASLHAGDAAVRAVYAAALGRDTAAPSPNATAAQRAHLAVAMGDGYPSVRWLAQRSLRQLEQRVPIGLGGLLERVDSMAGPEPRGRAVFETLDAIARLAPGRLQPVPRGFLLGDDLHLDLAAVVRLTDLQGENRISIGE